MRMKTLNKLLGTIFLGALATATLFAQTPAERIVTFRFPAGQDMFFIPWGGNDTELQRLYTLVDEYRAEITSGRVPVCVDGYCASLPTAKENLNTAFIRANRVKSELITHKGLLEEHFVTRNLATPYEGRKDMVVVTLRIPAKEEPRTPEPVVEKYKQVDPPVVNREPEVAEPEPQALPQPPATGKPYTLAIRTNLLYDAFLLPTLGVEWRVSPAAGIKVDGSRSWWGSETGKVQKIWIVSPEARWYMGAEKRFYVGAAANFGEFNVYKGMIGNIASKDTGYQGKMWNAGLTAGYQWRLSRAFSVDFNIGLGYSRFEYDTFGLTNEVRVYKDKDRTKNIYGPSQAGISLVWTIGGNR